MTQVIIIGGGLSGLSSAHTVLQSGGNVMLIDKNAFLGGNSTKATSGINGTLTTTQIEKKIGDSPATFYDDTAESAKELLRPDIARVLTYQSGAAVEWLKESFALDLSLVSRLGGHSFPRTHRGPERFPGMTITYALMEKLEEICKNQPHRAKVVNRAKVTKILKDAAGAIVGVEFERAGKKHTAHGPVIIASGGYGADYTDGSLLKKYRPELVKMGLATTNGSHCTGDGIKLASQIGASLADMKQVQVHPTGLVDPKEPDNKVKFLAAEALRGVGGLLLTSEGKRFCDELGHRDYVTGEMWKHKAPFRLVLNSKAASDIAWHVKHYTGRGLMKTFHSAEEVAAEMGISVSVLEKTFKDYNRVASSKTDPFGKKYFNALPFKGKDTFHVAVVTPVIHYTMGGLEIDADSAVVGSGKPIPGLWAAGEVCGGVHGVNRLGGSSLLDCVVFGRVAGKNAAKYLLQSALSGKIPTAGSKVASGSGLNISITPGESGIGLNITWGSGSGAVAPAGGAAVESSTAAPPPPGSDFYDGGASSSKAAPAMKEYTMAEVSKHNKKTDCWVIVNGQVLDVTEFMKDHPGGAAAILLFAGKDASAEFNMLHKPDVVEKYAPECVLGTLKGWKAGKAKL